MTEPNKKRLTDFGKVLLLVVIGFVALIAANGVWNGVAANAVDSFYGWVAGLNIIAEGFGIWFLYKKLFPKTEKKDDVKPYNPVVNNPVIGVEEQEEEYY